MQYMNHSANGVKKNYISCSDDLFISHNLVTVGKCFSESRCRFARSRMFNIFSRILCRSRNSFPFFYACGSISCCIWIYLNAMTHTTCTTISGQYEILMNSFQLMRVMFMKYSDSNIYDTIPFALKLDRPLFWCSTRRTIFVLK